MMSKPDVSELWIQRLRRENKTTQSFGCIYCDERRIFGTREALWEHAKVDHQDHFPAPDRGEVPLEEARREFELRCEAKR